VEEEERQVQYPVKTFEDQWTTKEDTHFNEGANSINL